MRIREVRAPAAPQPAGHYAQAVVHGGMAYVSAQLPFDPADGSLPEGVRAQTRQALKNVGAVLEEAGSGLPALLKVTVYLARIQDWGAMNEAYADALGDHRPARSVVAGLELKPGVLVAIDAIAVAGDPP